MGLRAGATAEQDGAPAPSGTMERRESRAPGWSRRREGVLVAWLVGIGLVCGVGGCASSRPAAGPARLEAALDRPAGLGAERVEGELPEPGEPWCYWPRGGVVWLLATPAPTARRVGATTRVLRGTGRREGAFVEVEEWGAEASPPPGQPGQRGRAVKQGWVSRWAVALGRCEAREAAAGPASERTGGAEAGKP